MSVRPEMAKTAYDSAKTAHGGGIGVRVLLTARQVTLTCGCVTRGAAQLSNPEKWWCCGRWRRRK